MYYYWDMALRISVIKSGGLWFSSSFNFLILLGLLGLAGVVG